MIGYLTFVAEEKEEPVIWATNRTWTSLRSKTVLRGEKPGTNSQNPSAASHSPVAFSFLDLDTLSSALKATDQFLTHVKHFINYCLS